MPRLLFPANNQIAYSSYQSGWTFGKLFYQWKPNLMADELLHVVHTLRLSDRLDKEAYQIGFILAYCDMAQVNGNRLPLADQIEELEQKLMGKLSQVKQEVSGFNGYLKVSQLAEIDASFCIRTIDDSVGNFGPQWDLQVQVDEPTAMLLNMGDTCIANISIPYKPEKLSGKDRMLQSLRDETPIHNAIFHVIQLKGGKTYNDLDEASQEICPCGAVVAEEDADPLGEIDEHPF